MVTARRFRWLSRHVRSLTFATMVVALVPGAAAVRAHDEPQVFTAILEGAPQVGCIVTTGDAPCPGGRVRATVIADGDPDLTGTFDFRLPGLGEGGARVFRRGGRGVLDGLFGFGGEAVHCVLRGRIRVQGVLLPSGASAQRFHTGTFEGRGRCAGRRARVRAFWSGSVSSTDGEAVLDHERFEGRLAGDLHIRGGGLDRHELPLR